MVAIVLRRLDMPRPRSELARRVELLGRDYERAARDRRRKVAVARMLWMARDGDAELTRKAKVARLHAGEARREMRRLERMMRALWSRHTKATGEEA